MNTEQTAALLGEAERRGLPATNCSRWPSTTSPNPGWYPSPAGRATLAGRLRHWAWTTGHAARPWTSRSASRDRAAGAAPSAAPSPYHAKRQYQHDHDDQHPQPC